MVFITKVLGVQDWADIRRLRPGATVN
jgi:hypothetical protein